jgi:hypothetical protein
MLPRIEAGADYIEASKFRHDEIAKFVMTNFFLHVLRYDFG